MLPAHPPAPLVIVAATRFEMRLFPGPGPGIRLVQGGLDSDLRRLIAPVLRTDSPGLVSFGFAGGLDPALRAGTLLLPRRLRHQDGRLQAADAAWRDRVAMALGAQQPVSDGDLLEARDVVTRPADKRRLHAATGAVAVDMESATLADIAADAGAPYLALRAVIDPADTTVPAPLANVIDQAGDLRPARLPGAIISAPIAFLQIAAVYWRASRALRSAVQRAGPALLSGGAATSLGNDGGPAASLAE